MLGKKVIVGAIKGGKVWCSSQVPIRPNSLKNNTINFTKCRRNCLKWKLYFWWPISLYFCVLAWSWYMVWLVCLTDQTFLAPGLQYTAKLNSNSGEKISTPLSSPCRRLEEQIEILYENEFERLHKYNAESAVTAVTPIMSACQWVSLQTVSLQEGGRCRQLTNEWINLSSFAYVSASRSNLWENVPITAHHSLTC